MFATERTFCEDFGRFLFGDALNLFEHFLGCISHRLHGVVAAFYEELDIAFREA
jgi:hypothetical protein